MTADAKTLIRGAKPEGPEPREVRTQPSSTLRVFVAGLARLGYETAALLSAAGVTAEQLEDPDGRVPCMSIPAVISQAMRTRPVKNLGIKVAAETPIGAFQLLDYLIVTSENAGQGMRQLARYLRLSLRLPTRPVNGGSSTIRRLVSIRGRFSSLRFAFCHLRSK